MKNLKFCFFILIILFSFISCKEKTYKIIFNERLDDSVVLFLQKSKINVQHEFLTKDAHLDSEILAKNDDYIEISKSDLDTLLVLRNYYRRKIFETSFNKNSLFEAEENKYFYSSVNISDDGKITMEIKSETFPMIYEPNNKNSIQNGINQGFYFDKESPRKYFEEEYKKSLSIYNTLVDAITKISSNVILSRY